MTTFVAVGDSGYVLGMTDPSAGLSVPLGDPERPTKVTLNGVARMDLGDGRPCIAVGDDGEVVTFPADLRRKIERRSSETRRNLNAVSFAPRTSTAFAVGDEGTILKTTTSGERWSTVASPTTRHLRAVFAADEPRLLVAGDEGTLLRSLDGGASWKVEGPHVSRHLRGLCFREKQIVAVGDEGTVLVCDNGSWSDAELTTKHLRAVDVGPNGVLIAVGDDGWIGRREPAPWTGAVKRHWAVNTHVTSKDLHGVAALGRGKWAIVGDDYVSYWSEDDGVSWQQVSAPIQLGPVVLGKHLRAVC
jgi:hypothetical protein